MTLGDITEVLQQVSDGELECDTGVRITLGDEMLKVLVLLQELILHGVPNNLRIKKLIMNE